MAPADPELEAIEAELLIEAEAEVRLPCFCCLSENPLVLSLENSRLRLSPTTIEVAVVEAAVEAAEADVRPLVWRSCNHNK